MRLPYKHLCLVMLLLILAGCSSHPLSQGRAFRLEKASFKELGGWSDDDLTQAVPALRGMCLKPAAGWNDFCNKFNKMKDISQPKLKELIQGNLVPYRVTSNGSSGGIVTGYYESELTGTRSKARAGQLPIYGLPEGYVKDKKIKKRHAIEESKRFNAPVIAWADDAVDLFILHVQGSGRLMTPEGEIRLGYAGNNGHDFKSLSSILAEENIPCGRSMPQMKQCLQANPDKARALMAKNPRYIFFREVRGETPYGSAGVVLTPQRSVAVDKRFIPMNTPLWLETKDARGAPIRRLVVAQDTGNAIVGPIRADYFWGHGPEAFEQAGRMKSPGSYYLLLPKE